MTIEPLLTPEETAEILKMGVHALAERRRLKKGPDYIRVGGRVRYSPETIRQWLEVNTVSAGAA